MPLSLKNLGTILISWNTNASEFFYEHDTTLDVQGKQKALACAPRRGLIAKCD